MTVEEQLQWLMQLHRRDQQIAHLVQRLQVYPQRLRQLQAHYKQLQQQVESYHRTWRETRMKREEKELQMAKLEQQMEHLQATARQARSNREYAEMLLRIEDVRHRIRQMEDELLEWMIKEEQTHKAWKQMEQTLRAQMADVEREIEAVRQEQQALEKQLQQMRAERDAFALQFPRNLLQIYERIARNRGGIAMAEVHDQICSACHIQLRPRLYQSLVTMETLVTCENCQRILFLPEWVQSGTSVG